MVLVIKIVSKKSLVVKLEFDISNELFTIILKNNFCFWGCFFSIKPMKIS